MATLTPPRQKPPLRVPRDARGPIPSPIDDEELDGASPAILGPSQAVPAVPDPFEEEEEEENFGLNIGAALNEAQKKKVAARKLPTFSPRMKFEEFITLWKQFSPDQKDHIVIYWYRLKPIIDRKLSNPNNPNYIDCIGSDEQMSIEYMINTHGGGKYHGRVNDTDVRKNGQVTEIFFDINQAQHEPILDLEELDVNHRENLAFVSKLKGQGKIGSDGRIVKNITAEAKREENMSATITNRLLDRVLNPPALPPATNGPSDAQVMLNFLLEKMKQEDPTKQLANILAIVAQLTPKQSDDTALKFMQLMESQRQSYDLKLAEMNRQMLELLTKPKEQSDLAGEVEKIKGIAEAIGLGGGGGKVTWVDRLIDTVGPAIPGIVNILSSRLAPAPAPMSQNPGVPRFPNELPSGVPSVPGEVPPQSSNQTPGLPGGTPEAEHMAFLDMVIQISGSDIINAIANGVSGYDAADSIINLKGLPTYNMIIKDGKESIVAAMQRNQQFLQQISRITTDVKLNQWLEEFCMATDNEGEGEDVEPPVAPKKTEKKGKAN